MLAPSFVPCLPPKLGADYTKIIVEYAQILGVAMFGVGFFEVVVILVVAVLFLGPDKLPGAIVDVAKFLKAVKKTLGEAKESFDKEVNLAEIKADALKYKNEILGGVDSVGEQVSAIKKDLALDKLNDLSMFESDSSADSNVESSADHSTDSALVSNMKGAESNANEVLDSKKDSKKSAKKIAKVERLEYKKNDAKKIESNTSASKKSATKTTKKS